MGGEKRDDSGESPFFVEKYNPIIGECLKLRPKAPRKTKKREKYKIDVMACRDGYPDFVRRNVYTVLVACIEGKEMPSSGGLDKFRELGFHQKIILQGEQLVFR